MSSPFIAGLASSPDILIHNFDAVGDRALIIRLTEDQRRKSSFLDDRILGPGVEGGWAPWPDAERAAAQAPAAKARFIFHIGHCGSTLLSRLIEAASGVRSLREPAALRTLASAASDAAEGLALWSDADWRRRLALYLNVASKGAPTVIKTTSWCGGLVSRTAGPAVFCYAQPDAYIATMLGGANNPVDLKLNAPIRLRRLRRLCAAPVADLSALSAGELAAMSWACEAATMAAADSAADRLLAVEFDRFLQDPEEGLALTLAHLAAPATADAVRAALSGPTMRAYSKDSTFDYSPADRRALITQYRAAHAGEIARGMKWMEAAAKAHAPVAAALARYR